MRDAERKETMSDTPKTDALAEEWDGNIKNLWRELRQLERENVVLKQRILDDNKAYGCELRDPYGTIWDHAKRLQQENAALREDKERLDWLNIHMECHCHDEDGFHSWLWVKAPATNKDLRAASDAARKEAQP